MYPVQTAAILLPLLAFPAWMLDLPPMLWHFSQRNVAAGSLILWIIMINLLNSINPLIWPRDNVQEWWDGNVYCDIQVRIQVGANIGLASCTAMIMRKLASVMDTDSITVTTSRNSRLREKALEFVMCWGYPFVMVLLYYIVQPVRYFIFGFSGCTPAFDASWPSIIVAWMWGPITISVAAGYAGLLIYRLHRYRREFHRLVAAQNTTKSRFLRLFIMAIIVILVYLPFNFYILYRNASEIVDTFDWSVVHGPNWNTIIKVPSQGYPQFEKYGQIATGYVVFFIFGTGADAKNSYKRLLCIMGLGKVFPSLYRISESGTSSSGALSGKWGWYSSLSSKAKSLFSKSGSVTDDSTRQVSMAFTLDTPTTAQSMALHPMSTTEHMLPERPTSAPKSVFARIFTRRNHQAPVLPIFAARSSNDTAHTHGSEKSPADTVTPGIHSRAWASQGADMARLSEDHGVRVQRDVRQDHQQRFDRQEGHVGLH
ncbi:pheromone A receptor-domain-containing protein [Massariosphaeria phaeospora]|uniref:Pheromone A receptor-domain-containing protein n=1 Tax=Massariosphaeria phaeospora TaxID=100035 RepID=A0A7C8IAM3_9PLEO|nr:pheromone A receptor-domain-containing protein [Massariosphaeria phaeospora]